MHVDFWQAWTYASSAVVVFELKYISIIDGHCGRGGANWTWHRHQKLDFLYVYGRHLPVSIVLGLNGNLRNIINGRWRMA